MHRGKGMKFVGDSRIPADKKPNVPKDYSEYPGKTEAFWPNFLLKEWMVGSVFLIGFLCLTIAEPSPLERMADPTDAAYIPLPDWYFLFLYELLKYEFAAGPYTVMGAVVMPGIAFTALILAPWLDRGPKRRPVDRPIATGLMLLSLASIIFLTWQSVVTHDWKAAEEQGKAVAEVEVDMESEGYNIFANQSCVTCHGEDLKGGAAAPALVGNQLNVEEVTDVIKNGRGAMPGGQFQGSDEELATLAEFIASLKAEE
ncbi:menaquinol-cytochrome c reductase cytochrome b/c subunit [Massilibacterium senegalense]|uniref:menaquinol-cytochrome c reductase cytochrome b/c subunit n=1 Tax=Massilibacterium senegalense TaxID=1632858 RepID=UPI0007851CFC|nr:menaquinol-cytochrome c reductase cytochrome b/c subunit [Massilibacterium senegalense]